MSRTKQTVPGKAEALKAKLPSEEEGSSQTVTTTAKEREERAKEAGRQKEDQ